MSRKIEQELDRYFLPREQLAENRKSDGQIYHVYRAWLKEAHWLDGQPSCIIIKEIPKSMVSVYDTLTHICHPNLETVYGVIEGDDRCYAINEYIMPPSCLCQNHDTDDCQKSLSLENFIVHFHGNFNERELSLDDKIHQAFAILLQLCEALEPIHEKGLIHGDIHPGNILLTDAPDWQKLIQSVNSSYCVKLIDFDNTQIPKEPDHTVTRLMGTKPFAAPEILDFSHPLDRADIYSLGCILYYMIYGKSPKEYTPNDRIPTQKWVKRIFRRCTASYEARYRNISALKKDLLRALHTPANPISNVLHKIPGFRSHTLWKMAIALYMYLALILSAGYAFLSIFQTGFPIQKWQLDIFIVALFYILEIIFVFDVFHLAGHSKYYTYLKDAHPILKYLVQIIIAALIFLVFVIVYSFTSVNIGA